MDFDVLPGPPLAELARTAMARACAAVVGCVGSRGLRAFTVPVRISPAGHPILLPRRGSALARELAAGPAMVTVTVPADAPLRYTWTLPPHGFVTVAVPPSVPFTFSDFSVNAS